MKKKKMSKCNLKIVKMINNCTMIMAEKDVL